MKFLAWTDNCIVSVSTHVFLNNPLLSLIIFTNVFFFCFSYTDNQHSNLSITTLKDINFYTEDLNHCYSCFKMTPFDDFRFLINSILLGEEPVSIHWRRTETEEEHRKILLYTGVNCNVSFFLFYSRL